MLVRCNQCQAKLKLKIKSRPQKTVTFKCSKCHNVIKLSPDKISAALDKTSSARQDKASADQADTVKAECSQCGNTFVKKSTETSSVCYQCRIDSIVSKVKDKYGTEEGEAQPEGEGSGRYTIRTSDGLVLGPIKIHTVAVLAREKRIRGVEEVKKDDSEYRSLMQYPELAEMFPELKEIMDTEGLEDKVDEAFMAAFGGETEEDSSALAEATTKEVSKEEEPELEEEETPAQKEEEAGLSEEDYEIEMPSEPEEEEAPAPAEEEEPEPAEEDVPEPKEEEAGLTEEDYEIEMPPEPEEGKAPEPKEEEAVLSEEEFDIETPSEPVEKRPAAFDEEPIPLGGDEDSRTDIIDIGDLSAGGRESAPEPREAEEEEPAPKPAGPAVTPQVPEEEVGTEFDLGDEEQEVGEAAGAEVDEEDIIEDLEPVAEAPPDARYRIRYPDGLMLGPVKIDTIRELFEAGNLTGQEDIQREDEDWVPFADLPELYELVSGEGVEDVVELTESLE